MSVTGRFQYYKVVVESLLDNHSIRVSLDLVKQKLQFVRRWHLKQRCQEWVKVGQRGLWKLEGPYIIGQLQSYTWVTTVASEIRLFRVADSSLYRGGISSRYIKQGLSRSLGRKGLCVRVQQQRYYQLTMIPRV